MTKPAKSKSKLSARAVVAIVLIVLFYILLYATVWTTHAVVLIFLLPLGCVSLLVGMAIWFIAVMREAREKDLF